MLADKKEAVVVEMGLTSHGLRKSEEGILVASNAFLTFIAEEMKHSEPTAFTRHDFARKYLHGKKSKVDKESMRELVSDHSIPICTHDEINTIPSVSQKRTKEKYCWPTDILARQDLRKLGFQNDLIDNTKRKRILQKVQSEIKERWMEKI